MIKKLTNPRIYVVLPVFNRLKFTKQCLSSLKSQNYKNFTVIIIDDGSTDGTRQYIERKYPQWDIIMGDGNWWWTKSMYEGVSFALKYAKKGDYILEMNNDCYFESGYLKQLIKTSKRYPNSIIGSTCVVANKPTKVVEIGVRIDWPSGLVYAVAKSISDQLSYYKNMDVVDDIDALPGKGTLIPIKTFKKAGNFDYKRLPHYIADYEFTIRAKRHGFNLVVDTKAIIKHHWNATGISSKRKNQIKSYKKVWLLLFGRKSMNNIIDWLTFILIACPKEYIAINLYFTLLRLGKAVFSVYPLYYLKPVFQLVVNIYHYIRYYKLTFYRLYLKIKQFPEYHLNRRSK